MHMSILRLWLVMIVSPILLACNSTQLASHATTAYTIDSKTDVDIYRPSIIAHRGASGYLPEHTLQAATLAFMQGADFIEQDIVLTKDDVPIVLHDIYIDTVTNVNVIFPQRARSDGRFYAIDFTWDEIQQLSVHERQTLQGKLVYPERYTGNEHFSVASLEQHISLIEDLNFHFNKSVGYYPEIKAPEWHGAEGKDITKIVYELLRSKNLTDANANIYIQSFDPNSLKRLRFEFGVEAKLVQLLAENEWEESTTNYDFLMSAKGIANIAQYADGIGPWIPQLVNITHAQPDEGDYVVSQLTYHARNNGLTIHPYTFRQDALVLELDSDELLTLLFTELKVDGLFTDQTDVVYGFLYGG